MNHDQIGDGHRVRLAYVYIRQSSAHQVRHNLESQRRQRGLVQRAITLGWDPGRIVEVDEDLGITASRSGERLGFEDMVATAALGKIGIILALEVARLCRSSSHWYHLLDICAITRTLIADGDGLYDPGTYNDRLLLGLKATMSEAELHVMKQRLVEAVLARARRGELRRRLPAGYEWDEAGRIQKTADEQEQAAIELVFRRFDELGTMHQTHLSLVEEGVSIPVRRPTGEVEWKVPSAQNVRSLLTNPVHGGIYAYGRRQTLELLDADQRPIKRMREVERDRWHAFIEDHHEGYITLEVFERNQERIRDNRRGGGSSRGAPREGDSLLQGLVLCGACGRAMKVAYGKGSRPTYYRCTSAQGQRGGPICQSFGAVRVERAVEELVFEALQPVALEAMIRAAETDLEARLLEQAHWRQRIERAEYEAELRRRHYHAVDPSNRLVARELERRLERALEELEAVRDESEARLAALPAELSDEEAARLRELAHELPRLWRAPSTRSQDRKRIVRCLIDQVVVSIPEEGSTLEVEVYWNGGEVTTLAVKRGRTGGHRWAAEPELIELIRGLAQEFSDVQIARILHRRRLRTPKGLTFTGSRVAGLRKNHGIPSGPTLPRGGDDIYTAQQAGEILEVDRSTVIRWAEVGLLRGGQSSPAAPWRIHLTEEAIRRLKAADAPEGWLTLKAAALDLGVSQQTVLQKLKSGQLEGIRVHTGRRSAWRILIDSTPSKDQITLFE